MKYTTRDQLKNDVKNYIQERLDLDERLLQQIKQKEIDIQNSPFDKNIKKYGMNILQKISYKHELITRAHFTQSISIDVSSDLLEYFTKLKEIDEKYESQIKTFENQINKKNLFKLENEEIVQIENFVKQLDIMIDQIPDFSSKYIQSEVQHV